MIIYFDSLTGNTKRFVDKVQKERPEWQIVKVTSVDQANEKGHLITFTTGIGNIPISTTKFMKKNSAFVRTVSTTGNTNWGLSYGLAADKISKHYKIPLLMKLELSGTRKDVAEFIQKIETFEIEHSI